MELVSNLAWLVACAILWGVWFRFIRPDLSAPERRRALTAIAVLALLLFPVISVSDDLHMNLLAVEPQVSEHPMLIECAIALLASLTMLTVISRTRRGRYSDRAPVRSLFVGDANICRRPPPSILPV